MRPGIGDRGLGPWGLERNMVGKGGGREGCEVEEEEVHGLKGR